MKWLSIQKYLGWLHREKRTVHTYGRSTPKIGCQGSQKHKLPPSTGRPAPSSSISSSTSRNPFTGDLDGCHSRINSMRTTLMVLLDVHRRNLAPVESFYRVILSLIAVFHAQHCTLAPETFFWSNTGLFYIHCYENGAAAANLNQCQNQSMIRKTLTISTVVTISHALDDSLPGFQFCDAIHWLFMTGGKNQMLNLRVRKVLRIWHALQILENYDQQSCYCMHCLFDRILSFFVLWCSPAFARISWGME